MTIKKQLSILIIILFIFPLICIFAVSFANRLSNSVRFLEQEFEVIQNSNPQLLHPDQWNKLSKKIKRMSPGTDITLLSKHVVIFSTVKEFEEGDYIPEPELVEIINKQDSEYLFQIERPSKDIQETEVLLLCRINKNRYERRKLIYNIFIAISTTFIILNLILISQLSHSIFHSLLVVQKQTESLAAGNLSENLLANKKIKNNEINNIIHNLETMRLSLLDTKERQDKFIMGISHDLRSPIALIKGYLEGISDGIFSNQEEIDNALKIINSKTEQLENMINELIYYEKLDYSSLRQQFVKVNLYLYAKEFLDSGIKTGSIFKRKLTGSINIDQHTYINMNPTLVQRLVQNLFSNATRYTKEDDSINCSLTENENEILFTISDTGCGMTQEESSKIFDLFYRVSNSRNDHGMGIGLSVVKYIVDLHEWKIHVVSEKDKGTSFIITIPKNLSYNKEN